MANTQDIRRRIKSIRNTAQITKAMQMVAASKMRRAQQHALAGRPYAAVMNRVLVSLQRRTDPTLHPLLQVRELKKELVLIISTDKGLAGALNTNLFREAANFDQAKTAFVVTGKKARQFVARTKRELLADFELKDAPSFVETKAVSKFCTEKFLNREVDNVSVLYTHFINTINQRPVVQTLLPISSFDLPKSESAEGATEDVDLLIDTDPDNQARVKKALEVLPQKAILELGADDFRKYTVVRVSDEILVDVMTAACGIDYKEASRFIEVAHVQGVPIPFATPQLLCA